MYCSLQVKQNCKIILSNAVKLNKYFTCWFIIGFWVLCFWAPQVLCLDSAGDIVPHIHWNFHFAYIRHWIHESLHGVPWLIVALMQGSAAAKRLKNTGLEGRSPTQSSPEMSTGVVGCMILWSRTMSPTKPGHALYIEIPDAHSLFSVTADDTSLGVGCDVGRPPKTKNGQCVPEPP